jgi:hypothetical protein
LRIFIGHYEEDWMQACHCTLEIGMLLSKTFKVEKVFDRKKATKKLLIKTSQKANKAQFCF